MAVTHGHGAVHPELWTDIFFSWWNATYPYVQALLVFVSFVLELKAPLS